jgi:hypothetical protein
MRGTHQTSSFAGLGVGDSGKRRIPGILSSQFTLERILPVAQGAAARWRQGRGEEKCEVENEVSASDAVHGKAPGCARGMNHVADQHHRSTGYRRSDMSSIGLTRYFEPCLFERWYARIRRRICFAILIQNLKDGSQSPLYSKTLPILPFDWRRV